MRVLLKIGFVLMIAVWISACSSTGDKSSGADVAVEDKGAGQGMDMGGQLEGMALDDPSSPLSQRVIYFEFDSSEVRSEDKQVVAAHAAHMASNSQVNVTLEGHGDERGSREYNIGLGDRRAQSVRRMLEFQGVLASQLNTVSYGEEKPVDTTHGEQAWAINRRVEIVYR